VEVSLGSKTLRAPDFHCPGGRGSLDRGGRLRLRKRRFDASDDGCRNEWICGIHELDECCSDDGLQHEHDVVGDLGSGWFVYWPGHLRLDDEHHDERRGRLRGFERRSVRLRWIGR
jgi:hypothetical protein